MLPASGFKYRSVPWPDKKRCLLFFTNIIILHLEKLHIASFSIVWRACAHTDAYTHTHADTFSETLSCTLPPVGSIQHPHSTESALFPGPRYKAHPREGFSLVFALAGGGKREPCFFTDSTWKVVLTQIYSKIMDRD